MTTPDLMPLLRVGTGDTPANGGCLVQVASYLHDGKSWDDNTPCVHPTLRQVAIQMNDVMGDKQRQRLAPLAADLVGTGPEPDDPEEAWRLSLRLAVWCCRQAAYLMNEDERAVLDAIAAGHEASEAMLSDQLTPWIGLAVLDLISARRTHHRNGLCAIGAAKTGATLATTQDGYPDMLAGLIAEHRRLTGTTPPHPARWHEVCDLLGTS